MGGAEDSEARTRTVRLRHQIGLTIDRVPVGRYRLWLHRRRSGGWKAVVCVVTQAQQFYGLLSVK